MSDRKHIMHRAMDQHFTPGTREYAFGSSVCGAVDDCAVGTWGLIDYAMVHLGHISIRGYEEQYEFALSPDYWCQACVDSVVTQMYLLAYDPERRR